MKDEIVSIQTAWAAKAAGFDELCQGYYIPTGYGVEERTLYEPSTHLCKNSAIAKSCVTAPTQSLVQRWLREKMNVHVYVNHYEFVVRNGDGYYFHIGKSVLSKPSNYVGKYKTYEKALEAGLIVAFTTMVK